MKTMKMISMDTDVAEKAYALAKKKKVTMSSLVNHFLRCWYMNDGNIEIIPTKQQHLEVK